MRHGPSSVECLVREQMASKLLPGCLLSKKSSTNTFSANLLVLSEFFDDAKPAFRLVILCILNLPGLRKHLRFQWTRML
jgi:hypothetical protein